MLKRIKKATKYVQDHPRRVFFGAGVVVGGVIVHSRHSDLRELLSRYEDMLDQNMHMRVSPDELRALLEGTTDALVSSAPDDLGGSIYVTLR